MKKITRKKYLTVAIDDDLHYKFKGYCISNKISMREALVIAITLILKKRSIKKH